MATLRAQDMFQIKSMNWNGDPDFFDDETMSTVLELNLGVVICDVQNKGYIRLCQYANIFCLCE